jgi:hypothetical protein
LACRARKPRLTALLARIRLAVTAFRAAAGNERDGGVLLYRLLAICKQNACRLIQAICPITVDKGIVLVGVKSVDINAIGALPPRHLAAKLTNLVATPALGNEPPIATPLHARIGNKRAAIAVQIRKWIIRDLLLVGCGSSATGT